MNRSTLLAAEDEATRILADARVTAHWVDCPTPHDDWNDYPNCQSAWQESDYVLRVMPKAMVAVLENSSESLGFAPDCGMGPLCMAGVFYDRVWSGSMERVGLSWSDCPSPAPPRSAPSLPRGESCPQLLSTSRACAPLRPGGEGCPRLRVYFLIPAPHP